MQEKDLSDINKRLEFISESVSLVKNNINQTLLLEEKL